MNGPTSHETGYRWATVTPDDKSGVIYIVTFLAFTYSTITILVRYFIKWHMLGYDDATILLAQVVGLVQFSFVLMSLKAGLGQTFERLGNDQYHTMTTYLYANQIALYLTLGFSKLATILLVRRLFTSEMRTAWLVINTTCGIMAFWTILSAVLVSAGCSPASVFPRIASSTCHGIQTRYRLVIASDALTELSLIVVPTVLCWHLKMSLKMKMQILAVFLFRLPLIPVSALSLKAWTVSLSASNPGVARYPAIVYQQSQVGVSIVAATIPCMMSWLRSFDTVSGNGATLGASTNDGSRGQISNRVGVCTDGYQLSSFKRNALSSYHSNQIEEIDPEQLERMRSRTFASLGRSPSQTRTTTSDACSERGPRTSHGSESVLVVSSAMP